MTFSKLSNGVTRFIKNNEGASAIEYVVIIALVALVIVGLMPGVSTAITGVFTRLTTMLNAL